MSLRYPSGVPQCWAQLVAHEDGSPADVDVLGKRRARWRACPHLGSRRGRPGGRRRAPAPGRRGPARRELMRRGVDVGPGVRDEVDPSDLERRAGGIPGGGRLMSEECRNHRRRDARMGRHPVEDLVAQVHDAGVASAAKVRPSPCRYRIKPVTRASIAVRRRSTWMRGCDDRDTMAEELSPSQVAAGSGRRRGPSSAGSRAGAARPARRGPLACRE